ncbi:MAG: YCF48-related protein [Nitrospirae bacterium]|nr:YCF48-related protein [Nitrospirota bacterium]
MTRIFRALAGVLLALGGCQSQTTGLTWTPLSLGSQIQPTAVSCPVSGTCFAVGQNGMILRTVDGGVSWTTLDQLNQASALANFNLTGISCPSSQVCYIIGNQGLILTTSDGGQTFQIQNETVNGNLTLNAVACQTSSAPACVAVGNNNSVFILSQLSGYWIQDLAVQTEIGPANYNQVALEQGTILISAMTQSGQGVNGLLESLDGGGSFLFLPVSSSLAPQGISGIACQSAGQCVADGAGALLVSGDGGQNWYSASVYGGAALSGSLTGVAATSDGSFWAYGASGALYQIPPVSGGGRPGQVAYPQTLPGNTVALTVGGVSCQSAGLCLAVTYSPSVPGIVYRSSPPGTSSSSSASPTIP